MRRTLALFALLLVAGPARAADLFVSDIKKDVVHSYSGKGTGLIDDFIPAQSGGLRGPQGLAWGPDGNLYVASSGANTVLRFNGISGAPMGPFVPGGPGASGLIFSPDGILLTTSHGTNEVRAYDGRTGAYLGPFVTARSGGLAGPTGLTYGPDGNLYVASFRNSAVYRYHGRNGKFINAFVAPGNGGLKKPIGLTFGPDGNLYVCSSDGGGVLRYDGRTGESLGEFVQPGVHGMAAPQALVFGPDGNLYVSNFGSHGVLRYNGRTGDFIDEFVTGVYSPHFLIFTPYGAKLRVESQVIDFGTAATGSTKQVRFTLRNASKYESLRLKIEAPAAPFHVGVSPDPLLLPAGGKLEVVVTFTPTESGKSEGRLVIDSGEQPGIPITVYLVGKGR